MKSILTSFLTFLLVFHSSIVMAGGKVQIKDVNYQRLGAKQGMISISLKGNLKDAPKLTIKDNIIQVALRGAYVWPKINKKITVNKRFDASLVAYQMDKEVTRVRAILPFSLKGMENQIFLSERNGKIELNFPKLGKRTGRVLALGTVGDVRAAKKKVSPSSYDESYLQKLLKDQASVPEVKIQKRAKNKNGKAKVVSFLDKPTPKNKVDSVTMALAGREKSAKSGFPIGEYIGKFIAFLALVLLLFYGVVSLMKKGVFKKGKLGFLNNTKAVEVLNTTYVGPKRSVLMIRAHNQVFLVGSSEKGMHSLGEIKDVSGLLKTGEKDISGSNFDTNLGTAEEGEKEFRLKEVLSEVAVTNESNSSTALVKSEVKDKVRFSDQIKNKVKGLKPLQ
jgi:flagellar biogenesis protein FliO